MNIGKSDTFRRRLLLVWATEDMDVFLFCFKCSLNVQKQMSNVHGCQRWSSAFKVELLRSYGVKPNHVNVHIWTAVRPELKSRLQGQLFCFLSQTLALGHGGWGWWCQTVEVSGEEVSGWWHDPASRHANHVAVNEPSPTSARVGWISQSESVFLRTHFSTWTKKKQKNNSSLILKTFSEMMSQRLPVCFCLFFCRCSWICPSLSPTSTCGMELFFPMVLWSTNTVLITPPAPWLLFR